MARVDLLQGTLDLLVLKILARGPMHGFAIARRIERLTDDMLSVEEGSLYPALHRMERRGWLKAHWGASENNRKAKYYQLTRKGEKQLQDQETSWADFARAVGKVLHGPTLEPKG